MSDLLIHSMSEFADIILPCMAIAGARNIVEIGAEFGGMSQLLGGFAADAGGLLTSIDPAPKAEFIEWSVGFAASRHLAALSLDAIPTVSDIDAWVIDGDHNHFTVVRELAAIDMVGRRDGKPLLAFLHDVGWPCARRDCYYAPEGIPEPYRLPHDYASGAVLGETLLAPGRGFRGHGRFAFAIRAGGPGNGVLTAVEDFIADAAAAGRSLGWACIPAVFGLGVLFDTTAPWAAELAVQLLPFHDNRLLASLEDNRLRNYLKVIDLQDCAAAVG